MSGFLHSTHYATCGICGNWEAVADGRQGRAAGARQKGWKNTTENGWVCPNCQNDPGALERRQANAKKELEELASRYQLTTTIVNPNHE